MPFLEENSCEHLQRNCGMFLLLPIQGAMPNSIAIFHFIKFTTWIWTAKFAIIIDWRHSPRLSIAS